MLLYLFSVYLFHFCLCLLENYLLFYLKLFSIFFHRGQARERAILARPVPLNLKKKRKKNDADIHVE